MANGEVRKVSLHDIHVVSFLALFVSNALILVSAPIFFSLEATKHTTRQMYRD